MIASCCRRSAPASRPLILFHKPTSHHKGTSIKLVVSGPSSGSVTAGDSFQVTVKAEESGKTDTGDNQSITLTSSGGQKVIASPIKLKKGKATVSVTLDTADTTTLVASQGSVKGTSGSLTVKPAAAASFALNYDIVATAGSPFGLVVTALDAYGNIATGYHGTATITSGDGQTVSPSTVSFSSSSATPGVAGVNATLDKAGDTNLKATAGSVALTGYYGIIVEPAAAASFSVSAPGTVTAGAGFTVTVTEHDQYGNVTPDNLTATLASSDGETLSPSTLVFDNETGVATATVTLDKAGTATLTATAGSIQGTSNSIAVQPAAVASFAVKAPSTVAAGADFGITVTAQDQYGNIVTGYVGTATLSNVPYAHFPPTVTFGSPGETPGVAATTVYLYAAGDQTIKATADQITGSSNPIQVNPGPAVSFQVYVSSTYVTAGSELGVTVDAFDAYGNAATGYTGTATLTASDGQAVSPSTVTFGSSGEQPGTTFANVKLDEPDSLTLEATAGSITGSSDPITVDASTNTPVLGGWTGYASTPGSGVTAVGATWVEPKFSATSSDFTSAWVGIDGWNEGPVEQCGVAASLDNGTPKYVAWYEFFGDESGGNKGPDYDQQNLPSGHPVQPGDTISAEVSFVPGGDSREFLFQMTDLTQGWTWSLDQTLEYVTPARDTAEWIVEGNGPTADLSQVDFTGAWVTVNSTSGPINPLKDLVAISSTYQDGAPLSTTSNPPQIASSLGWNEPASGQQSSSFSVTYSADTGDAGRVVPEQTAATAANAASSGFVALNSDDFATGPHDNVTAPQQPATVANAVGVGLAALDSESDVEPQSLIAPVPSVLPEPIADGADSGAPTASLANGTTRPAFVPGVGPAAGLFTRPRVFQGTWVATPPSHWRLTSD